MVGLQNTELFSSRQKNGVLGGRNVKQLHTPFFPLCVGARCIDAHQELEDIDTYHQAWFERPRPIRGGARAIAPIGVHPHPPQTVPDMDPIFGFGTPRVQDHLVLKYKVCGCPLRGELETFF